MIKSRNTKYKLDTHHTITVNVVIVSATHALFLLFFEAVAALDEVGMIDFSSSKLSTGCRFYID